MDILIGVGPNPIRVLFFPLGLLQVLYPDLPSEGAVWPAWAAAWPMGC